MSQFSQLQITSSVCILFDDFSACHSFVPWTHPIDDASSSASLCREAMGPTRRGVPASCHSGAEPVLQHLGVVFRLAHTCLAGNYNGDAVMVLLGAVCQQKTAKTQKAKSK